MQHPDPTIGLIITLFRLEKSALTETAQPKVHAPSFRPDLLQVNQEHGNESHGEGQQEQQGYGHYGQKRAVQKLGGRALQQTVRQSRCRPTEQQYRFSTRAASDS
jgi:hypothetical protein